MASWADFQRDVPRTGPWHYVNVPISEARYDAKYCAAVGCVVSKGEDFQRLLADTSLPREERQRALKFLIHFLADLHHPLHVGDTGDRGGNDTQVRFLNRGSNLHRVWDSQIMVWHSRDDAVWLREVQALITPETIKAWSKGNPADWATESVKAAAFSYRLPGNDRLIKPGDMLAEEYCAIAVPIIQRQLARSAVRVAILLNTLYDY